MAYWLMKSEPEEYSWATFIKDGKAKWDGIRNYAARNNLRSMKVGDEAFFYHSNAGKETGIVGVMKVIKTAEPDVTFKPETGKPNPWLVVTVQPVKAFNTTLTLAQLRSIKGLEAMALFRQSRLSVQPVTVREWQIILQHAQY